MVALGFGFEILSQLLFKISWVVGFTKSMTFRVLESHPMLDVVGSNKAYGAFGLRLLFLNFVKLE